MDSQTDLDLNMRLNIYIDPGILFTFNHVSGPHRRYACRSFHRTAPHLSRLGKVQRGCGQGGNEDDQGPTNNAVRSVLNDLFGKIESDARLRHL